MFRPGEAKLANSEALPSLDAPLYQLSGACIFGKLKFSSACHSGGTLQIHSGMLRAPAFRELMDGIVRGTQGTIVYLYNVLGLRVHQQKT